MDQLHRPVEAEEDAAVLRRPLPAGAPLAAGLGGRVHLGPDGPEEGLQLPGRHAIGHPRVDDHQIERSAGQGVLKVLRILSDPGGARRPGRGQGEAIRIAVDGRPRHRRLTGHKPRQPARPAAQLQHPGPDRLALRPGLGAGPVPPQGAAHLTLPHALEEKTHALAGQQDPVPAVERGAVPTGVRRPRVGLSVLRLGFIEIDDTSLAGLGPLGHLGQLDPGGISPEVFQIVVIVVASSITWTTTDP